MGAAEVGRLWRTVRHLKADQWLWRAVVRGRLKKMEWFPARARARLKAAAERLPLADTGTPRLGALAEPVLALQNAVYGDGWRGAAEGRFRLLNREFDFGSIEAIAWRGDFGDGANPLRSNVLAYMGYVVPMLAAGDSAALAAAARLVRSLEAAGRFDAPGVFRDIWNAYSASHRTINLLSGLALYRQARGTAAPETDVDSEAVILAHARLCAAFVIANPERDIQYNHLMKNYVALSVYAAGCDAVPAELRFLETAVPATVRQNVLADGGHAERSPMYHALALLDVRILAATGLFAARWQPFLGETLARMEEALRVMSLADGEIGLFNDSWFGEAPRAADLVALSDAPDRALVDTGYRRLGVGGDSVLFDCGPCGPDENPAHAHADFLAVETTVDGARFLVDTGVPTYTAGVARDSSRSAVGHNGPRLDGAEPLEYWSSFRVGRRGKAFALDMAAFDGLAPLVAAGGQDGYARLGAEPRRFVGLWPGEGLLIADLWTGKGTGAAALGFLVDGSWAASADGFARDDVRVSVRALAGALSPSRPAVYWPRFDDESPAHRLDVAPEAGGGPVRAAVWFGWGDRAPPDAATLDSLFAKLAAARTAPTVSAATGCMR